MEGSAEPLSRFVGAAKQRPHQSPYPPGRLGQRYQEEAKPQTGCVLAAHRASLRDSRAGAPVR
eukprot:12305343-Prorocentrum_lima.AAC.1